MAEESSHGQTPHRSPCSYPQTDRNATPAFSAHHSPLLEKIRARIKDHGPVPFHDYMAMALYDDEFGYYASESQRVGKGGDFITSVSAGRCFGLILARRLSNYWEKIGKPDSFHIIEPGAHDGSLCADILSEAYSSSPEFYQAAHYHLIEATQTLAEAQQLKLNGAFSGKFTTHTSLGEIHGLRGAIISNELIDAFPVDLIRFQEGVWRQLFVGKKDGKLELVAAAIKDASLISFCDSLGTGFPEGYTTEYNPSITEFTREAAGALAEGLFITIDYGHHAEDYYHPDRSDGTLQTYHKHQKSDDPLAFPGEIDITSHVDFTRLTTAAESAGFEFISLRTQGSYLCNHAREWLISLENNATTETPALLRQFQTLTHPAMLGTKFMVLEMKKNAL